MTLKTVPITGILYNPDGSVAANAVVVAQLTTVDTDGGVVVPGSVSTTTDAGGVFTLNLWPNSRGVNGSQYLLRGQMPGALPGVLLMNLLITVPDSDPSIPVPVSMITNRKKPDALSDAKAAMLAAQGAALQVAGGVTAAAGSAAAAAGSAAGAASSRAAIDNRLYPGLFVVAPTTRPDGAPPQDGDRYTSSAGVTFQRIGGAWADYNATAAAAATTAAGAADTATTQAGIATGAAGTATTQAGIATGAAGAAAGSATSAGNYAALAATGAKFFDTIALGNAGVADGATFGVKAGGSDGLLRPTVYRRDSAGAQTLLYAVVPGSEYDVWVPPTKARVDQLADSIFIDAVGTASPVTGTTALSQVGGSTFIFNKQLQRPGGLYRFIVSSAAAGTMKIKRYTLSGSTFTWQAEVSVPVVAGINTITPQTLSALAVQAGDFIGFYSPNGCLKFTSTSPNDTIYYSVAGSDNTTTISAGAANTSVRLEARVEFACGAGLLLDAQTQGLEFASVADDQGATITIGATAPADASGTQLTTNTYFDVRRNPEPGIVQEFVIYSKLACRAQFVVLQPTGGGGYSVLHKKNLTLVSGLNTFTVADGTLPLMKVPRACLFGTMATVSSSLTFVSPSAGPGLLTVAGEATGAAAQFGTVPNFELQFRVKVLSPLLKRKVADAQPRYIFDIDLTTAGALPAASSSAGMTYGTGYAVSNTTGLSAAYIQSIRGANIARAKSRHIVKATSGTAKIAIYRRPVVILAGVGEGTVCYFDVALNKIAICASWDGSATLPADATAKTCAFTIPQNVDLLAELTNDNKVITFKLTNPLTGESDSISVSVDLQTVPAAGFAYGAPGAAVLAGTGSVKSIRLHSLVYEPRVAFVGDSKVEGYGVTQAATYPNLAIAALGGLGIVSADGGTKTDATLLRTFDLVTRFPSLREIVFDIGTNDAIQDGATGVTNFQTNMSAIVALCTAYGVRATVMHQPPLSGYQTYIDSMNSYIRAQGWNTVRRDLRISLGHDGSTVNSTYSDGVHANTAGHAAEFDQIKIDQPAIFDFA